MKLLFLAVSALCLVVVTCEETQRFQKRNLPETVPEKLVLDPCKTASASGVFQSQQLNQNVFCEMTTFGGRWIVFQQRVHGQDRFELSFNGSFAEYQTGFGTIGKDLEFWLGLEALHQITSSGDYELFVELKDEYEKYGYARYSKFYVAGEDDKYRLTVGGYSGTASDALSQQNKAQFSTYDSDNDNSRWNCAKDTWSGGWWYNKCDDESAPNFQIGPFWPNFTGYYGTYTRMMTRHK